MEHDDAIRKTGSDNADSGDDRDQPAKKPIKEVEKKPESQPLSEIQKDIKPFRGGLRETK